MTPTILIAGATGNTGRSVVATLSSLQTTHRIIALTRSLTSPTAQHLATLPNVVVLEKPWVEITPSWLRSHHVVRAFIAAHNEPTQFAEESTFHLAALNAGVEYVVRISTTAANVRPDCPAYYPRSHWALEQLLDSPAFGAMRWTSLQPNIFASFYLAPAAEFVRRFRETGEQGTLRLLAAADAPVGVVDADEVGVFAARLLALGDAEGHSGKRYVINGPEDVTGEQVVGLVERLIGAKVERVVFKDLSGIDEVVAATAKESRAVVSSIRYAVETAWEGKCTASTTSSEVLEIAPPTRTAGDVLNGMLRG